MPVFFYDPPERFVAGAVGQPGSRAFFLQARAPGRLTTVALEKFQVALLADKLDELLDEVLRRSGGRAPVPAVPPADLSDQGPLEQPIMEDFRVGSMALAWDAESEQVIIEAQEISAEDESEAATEDASELTGDPSELPGDPPEPGDLPESGGDPSGLTGAPSGLTGDPRDAEGEDGSVLRVRISPAAARAFAQRALELVAAGRPPCPLCGQPLNEDGHICARMNGHRPDREA